MKSSRQSEQARVPGMPGLHINSPLRWINDNASMHCVQRKIQRGVGITEKVY